MSDELDLEVIRMRMGQLWCIFGEPSPVQDVEALIKEVEWSRKTDALGCIVISNEEKKNAYLQKENAVLKKEVEILRLYGNKDCTAMADEQIAKGKA